MQPLPHCHANSLDIDSLLMIVECKSLSFSYGSVAALSNVTIDIEPGCTGLLGSNGAGKSTLIRCIMGLRRVPKGRIKVLGVDPAEKSLEVRRLAGYMPENDVYIPGATGIEMAALCGRLCGLPKARAVARAHQSLDYLGLAEERYRQVHEYSTGMKQRLKFACALVHGPRLVLLDEPTTGMDPGGREHMLELIGDMARNSGISILLSTHILQDVAKVCDRIVLLSKGKVAFQGKKQDFFNHGKSRLAVKVKSGAHRLAELLRLSDCSVGYESGTNTLLVNLPPDTDATLIWKKAREAGAQVRRLAPLSTDMNELFTGALVANMSNREGSGG